uniref:Proteasome subunit beta n=1 Tax=Periophthalmus magnuspinnatus TaxID=409849 RepID=A0A3B4A8E2_9GOBI
MALSNVLEIPASGFNFENAARNAALEELFEGGKTPKPMKTGTTIAGVVFKDGVVLGADTRATASEVVADKMCAKIHYISPNIYCCGAGTAADTEKTTDFLSSNLAIFTLNSGRNPRLVMAANILQDMLYRYHGSIGANLILGGVDCTGNHLYKVGPWGSVDTMPYMAMGRNMPIETWWLKKINEKITLGGSAETRGSADQSVNPIQRIIIMQNLLFRAFSHFVVVSASHLYLLCSSILFS